MPKKKSAGIYRQLVLDGGEISCEVVRQDYKDILLTLRSSDSEGTSLSIKLESKQAEELAHFLRYALYEDTKVADFS